MYNIILHTYNERGRKVGEIVIPHVSDYASAMLAKEARIIELENEGLSVKWEVVKA